MDKKLYEKTESYMQRCMQQNVHDTAHVHRVLCNALRIAQTLPRANREVVISASLLHDIGREKASGTGQSHAKVGAQMAYQFLLRNHVEKQTALHVRNCILTHSHKQGLPPQSLEAEILYDADKLDLTGAIGTARAMLFGAEINEPLYTLDANGYPAPVKKKGAPSLLREYKRKLKHMPALFFTGEGKRLAGKRQAAMDAYFKALKKEINNTYSKGLPLLTQELGFISEEEISPAPEPEKEE